jgi:hypothetical protein
VPLSHAPRVFTGAKQCPQMTPQPFVASGRFTVAKMPSPERFMGFGLWPGGTLRALGAEAFMPSMCVRWSVRDPLRSFTNIRFRKPQWGMRGTQSRSANSRAHGPRHSLERCKTSGDSWWKAPVHEQRVQFVQAEVTTIGRGLTHHSEEDRPLAFHQGSIDPATLSRRRKQKLVADIRAAPNMSLEVRSSDPGQAPISCRGHVLAQRFW